MKRGKKKRKRKGGDWGEEKEGENMNCLLSFFTLFLAGGLKDVIISNEISSKSIAMTE